MGRKLRTTRDRERQRRLRVNRDQLGRMKKETKLTVCFYEYPAALQEIKFWEGLVKDKIINKERSGNFLNYLLDKNDHYEFVCCMPLQVLLNQSLQGLTNLVKNSLYQLMPTKEYVDIKQNWHKVLVFGKVDKDQLRPLERFMTLYNL